MRPQAKDAGDGRQPPGAGSSGGGHVPEPPEPASLADVFSVPGLWQPRKLPGGVVCAPRPRPQGSRLDPSLSHSFSFSFAVRRIFIERLLFEGLPLAALGELVF